MFFNKLYHNNDIATCFDRALERRILASVFYSLFFKDTYIVHCVQLYVQLEGFEKNIDKLQKVQTISRDWKM